MCMGGVFVGVIDDDDVFGNFVYVFCSFIGVI